MSRVLAEQNAFDTHAFGSVAEWCPVAGIGDGLSTLRGWTFGAFQLGAVVNKVVKLTARVCARVCSLLPGVWPGAPPSLLGSWVVFHREPSWEARPPPTDGHPGHRQCLPDTVINVSVLTSS